MKKIVLTTIMCAFLIACDNENKAKTESDEIIQQPFTFSKEPLTENAQKEQKDSEGNEIKQPFSLSSEPQTKSK